MTDPVPTVFFGSGGFAVPILEALLQVPDIAIVAVISAPDRPAGRGRTPASTPVAARARELAIHLLQPTGLRNAEAATEIAALRPGLGVLADYGRIVPAAILDIPAGGMLNVHPSLLPRWRGASPIPATILAGDAETGVTIIRMDAGLDTGPIVAVERWRLASDEDAPTLEARAAQAGAALLRRTVGPWLRGEVVPRPQGDVGVTLTRPLRREDGRLDPARPATALERQVRAYRPWPGTYLETVLGRIGVLEAVAEAEPVGPQGAEPRPGRFGQTGMEAGDGRCLVLRSVQPAGGRPMSWQALLRGRPGLLDTTVLSAPA